MTKKIAQATERLPKSSRTTPPTGAQEGWEVRLKNKWKSLMELGFVVHAKKKLSAEDAALEIESYFDLEAFIREAITAAEEREYERGFGKGADFTYKEFEHDKEKGAAAHHKQVVEMIWAYKNYYNPIGDEFNKGRHAAWDAMLAALTTSDPEKELHTHSERCAAPCTI